MSYVATILSAVGGVVSGIGQMQSAKQEVQIGEYNAKIYEQKAEAERKSQELLEYQKRKTIDETIGTQIALYGSSGIRMTGSPINVMLDSLTNGYLDIAIDKYNSEVTARGYTNEGKLQRYEAEQRKRVGYAKASTSFLSTAANLAMTLGGKTESLGTTQDDKPYTKVVWK